MQDDTIQGVPAMSDGPITILMLEDDPSDLFLIRRMLDEIDASRFALVTLSRLSEALARLDGGGIDVVLTDLSLPDSVGLETFKRLHSRAPWVPIVVLTGLDSEGLAMRAVEEGAQDYLVKSSVDSNLLGRSLRYAMARQKADEALRESEERYALAVRGANDGLWDWNLRTNEVYFSPRWKAMLGHGEEEIGPKPEEWLGRIHPEDVELVREKITAHLDNLTSHFQNEHRMKHKDGTWRWMLTRGLAVRTADGQAYRMAGSQTDITNRKRAEEQLLHNAFHDALTGLPNRALFHDRLERSIRRTKRRNDYNFAVLFLDIDRFKLVNDSLGHLFGDQLLVEFCRRLEECVRPGDTIARLGGDEFVILLEDAGNVMDAQRIAERVHDAMQRPFQMDTHELFNSVSIGIALSSTGYDLPEQVIRDADTAMYRAKAKGRGRHEVFDKAMHDRAVAMLQLENDLRRAVDKKQFWIQYQPIINLSSGRIKGFEALVRWQHPKTGTMTPSNFIPLAEETGLIVPMGWWVLRAACRQMKAWQEGFPCDPPLTISVNLSNKQFMAPNLLGEIKTILDDTGLDPRTLILEITESVLMSNSEESFEMLSALRKLKVQLHIDDFGTGYSSLSYLQHIPTDTLKIDRSFISKMLDSEENSEIVRTIVTLARTLGMRATAEGVETADQLERARLLECEDAQGFFFSEPLGCSEVEEMLAAGKKW